jgi:Mrp family chromosome partitioning ATPase
VQSHASAAGNRLPSGEVRRTGQALDVVVKHVELPRQLDQRCVLLREPASAQARSYRLLRHRLLTGPDPRVIAVTSAVDGEGKTTCAINLALCIADETFAKVLLLEANPRRPSIARAFGMPTLLESANGGSDAVGTSRRHVFGLPSPRMHVASAFACAVDHGGLDRVLLSVSLQDLREVYDYIIVDTASVLDSADADVACECADGVVVVARARSSRRGTVERAINQLSPAPICGVVLLDV